jgi:RNA polymerase sigma factor (sigma-70 family)
MEVGTVPQQAPDGGYRGRALASPKGASDEDLVALIRAGNGSAFETVDARYRTAILGYCRQLLSDRDEAEDAVQHTFLAAYTGLLAGDQEIELRPWLYTIARNRCYSILRSRREVTVAEFELEHGTSEEPDALVQRREDLRDLVFDVRRLPDDQRAALVMAELGAHSHDEIAGVLEVPRAKVKALVFQARASLMATRTARETDCADIRRQLRVGRGAALRRGALRRHLHDCAECREYRHQLRYQRTQFAAAVTPLGLWMAFRAALPRLGAAGRDAPAAGGAGAASAAIKLGALKPLAGVLAAMLSAASAVVAVHSMVLPHARVARHIPALHHAASPRRGQLHAPARAAAATTTNSTRIASRAAHRSHVRASAGSRARARRRLPTPITRSAFMDRRLARGLRLATSRAAGRGHRRSGAVRRAPIKPPVISGLPIQIPVALPPVAVPIPGPPDVLHGPKLPTGDPSPPPSLPPDGGGPGDHPGDPGGGPGTGPGDPGPPDRPRDHHPATMPAPLAPPPVTHPRSPARPVVKPAPVLRPLPTRATPPPVHHTGQPIVVAGPPARAHPWSPVVVAGAPVAPR